MAMADEGNPLRQGLVGRWVKLTHTPQAEQYPDYLEFTERGTFVGSNDPGSRYHPYWDAGRIQLLGEGKVRIPTANDAQIDYIARLEGDELIFMMGTREEVRYRRKK